MSSKIRQIQIADFEKLPNQFIWRAHFGTRFAVFREKELIFHILPPGDAARKARSECSD
jgi:hypothetical protein